MSEAVENYLTAMLRLEDQSGTISTSALAQRLEVAPASVTAMIKKLADRGLIVHRRYHGASLTEAGRRLARGIVRRHRLVETFLVRVLELPAAEVHVEAHRLEHAFSDRVIDRLDAWLGRPELDPHGSPIPRDE